MRRLARLCVPAAMAMMSLALMTNSASGAEFEKYGLESVSATTTTSQAGAHPDVTLKFALKTDPASPATVSGGLHEPYALTKDLGFEMPPGLLGNLNAVDQCPVAQFINALERGGCPFSSQVGVARNRLYPLPGVFNQSIFLLEPPKGGNVVARLGLYVFAVAVMINVRARSDSDYGLTARIEGASSNAGLVNSEATLWGVPGDPKHDNRRLLATEYDKSVSPPREFGRPPEPFLTNPTTCGAPLTFGFTANSYQLPDQVSRMTATMTDKEGNPAPITGCNALDFDPSFEATPTTHAAGAPTGLDATLKIPQNEAPEGLATSQLRNANVTFPAGMTINPDAGDGLKACTSQQAGYQELHPAECPLGSKIGSAEFDVPALKEPIQGAIYQRTPEPGNLFRIWLSADEQGLHLTLPGEIKLNPTNGQISSIFIDNPQAPLRELKLHLKLGPRAPLTNPPTCGDYATHYEFGPWSGNPTVAKDAPLAINEGCAGIGAFAPKLNAGSTSLVAGAFTGFALNLTRADHEQNIQGLDLTLPKGLAAKFAGVGICANPEALTGNCPASSQIGVVNVAAGPGSAPLQVPQPGKSPTAVYLAAPYKGAPFSLVVKVPAQAGPFDLGTVATRAALYVDPETAQGTVKSDPLPQFLQGVPVAYRTIHVEVTRPSFMLNPTSCEPKTLSAHLTSPSGATADPQNSFQVGECGALGFSPKLQIALKGGTKRGDHPALKAVLTAKAGQANIARTSVALPHSEFLAQDHIKTICTRVQFAANACPKASIYGKAKAITPLLDQPLEGPVYLRSSSHELPDLVADLNGQIHVALVGRIDSVNGGIRSDFEAVPDAPVSKFTLEMAGGKKGLLENSRDLCKSTNKASVQMDGQNGKVADSQSVIESAGCSKGKKKGKTGRKRG